MAQLDEALPLRAVGERAARVDRGLRVELGELLCPLEAGRLEDELAGVRLQGADRRVAGAGPLPAQQDVRPCTQMQNAPACGVGAHEP